MKVLSIPSLCLFILVSAVAHAENHFWGLYHNEPMVEDPLLLAPSLQKPTPALAKKYPAKDWNYFSIDLDQDGTPDFIVESKTEIKTCFVKSDLSVHACEKFNYSKNDGFAYEYFFNPGQGQMLALFDLLGDEDSSDYFLKEFDPKTWKLKSVTEIFPLIDSQTKSYKGLYWGYPWDIHGLNLKAVNGQRQFQATFKHSIDSGVEGGDSKPKGPAILFSGRPTQGEAKGNFEKLRKSLTLMSVEDVAASVQKK